MKESERLSFLPLKALNLLRLCICSWNPWNVIPSHLIHYQIHFLVLAESAFYQIWFGQKLPSLWIVKTEYTAYKEVASPMPVLTLGKLGSCLGRKGQGSSKITKEGCKSHQKCPKRGASLIIQEVTEGTKRWFFKGKKFLKKNYREASNLSYF